MNKITSFPDLRSKAMGIFNKNTSFPDTRRVAMGISNNYLLVYLYMSRCQSSGYRPLWHDLILHFEFCILNCFRYLCRLVAHACAHESRIQNVKNR